MDQPAEQQDNRAVQPEHALTLWQVVASVFAAGFGVQSKENKQRDFSRGKAVHFIIAGLILTFGLLAVLIAVVNVVV
jgi:hypothetical protein